MSFLDGYILDLRQRLKSAPIADACEKIIYFLVATPDEELQLLTFRSLENALDASQRELDIIAITTILKNNRPPALSMHYLFIDGDDEYEIDQIKARGVIRDGFMIDRNGVPVENPKEKLFPFFSISETFKKIKSDLIQKHHNHG